MMPLYNARYTTHELNINIDIYQQDMKIGIHSDKVTKSVVVTTGPGAWGLGLGARGPGGLEPGAWVPLPGARGQGPGARGPGYGAQGLGPGAQGPRPRAQRTGPQGLDRY